MAHAVGAPSAYPKVVTFEVTTRCNLACVMCAHGSPSGVSNKRDAPDRMVDTMLGVLDRIEHIHPTGVGEPMMAPGFWRVVDALAGREGPLLRFHTNGILLTAQNVARLRRTPLGRVNVSVDAANELTYRNIRGSDMQKTLNGIDRLVEAEATMPRIEMRRISMSLVLMKENIAELADFVRLAHAHGVRAVQFSHLTESFDSQAAWIVNRGNFQFNYNEQRLYDHPELSDRNMLEAFDVADELGVVIEGKELFLLSQNAVHMQRPCASGSIVGIFD